MILTDNMFAWREAYTSAQVNWNDSIASPAQVVTDPTDAGAPTIRGRDAQAVAVQRGHRIRLTLTYTLPSGEVETGVLLRLRSMAQVDYDVLRTALDPSDEVATVTADFVWHAGDGVFVPQLRLYGSTQLRVQSLEVRRVEEDDGGLRSWDTGTDSSHVLNAIAQPGDLAVLAMCSQFGTTAATAPEGWTMVHSGTTTHRSGFIAWKRVTSPTDTLSLAPMAADNLSSARKRCLLMVFKGDTWGFRPTDQEPVIEGWQLEAFTTLPAARQLLFSQRHQAKGALEGAWEAPDGPTKVVGEYSRIASWSQMRGALTSTIITKSPEGLSMNGWGRILLPGPPSVQVVRGGVGKPAKVKRFPKGAAATVAELLTQKPFWIAHRGGSDSWPEGTMKAYTESAARGVPALEVPVHCSKDGVWFVCHDLTLKRLDPSAPDRDVREMEWAEIKQYTVSGEPIATLEEVRETYAQDFVIFLDPKGSALKWQEAVVGFDPSRTVLKFSGDAVWLATQWKQLGWITWGYLYETSVADGQAQTWINSGVWDMVGMEFGADQNTWQQVRAWGKPVIAHVARTMQHYNAALGKNPAGIMMSGVAELVPDPLV